MWAGALGGVYTLPANGTQIAAANFDLSGTTKLGTKLVDHSFFVPMLVHVGHHDRRRRADRRRLLLTPHHPRCTPTPGTEHRDGRNEIADKAAALMPGLIEDLEKLVAIPSIAFPGYPAEPVRADGRA